jgi:hypothetical protein
LLAVQDSIATELRARLKKPEMEREPGFKVKTMCKEMREMKELMLRKERNLIDIGRKPILAIDQISQPILDQLKDAVEL